MASLQHQPLPSHAPTTDDQTNDIIEIINVDEANTVGVVMEALNISRNSSIGIGTQEVPTYMTWKDLWVTAWVSKNESKPILEGLTGYAKPGQLLAIMGPSGSGKSTLLDALGGRLSSNTRQIGEILINGHKQSLAYGTAAYVTQDDTLITSLTVREAVYYSAQLQLPDSMSKAEKKQRADFTIREMGLQDAINTRIGGWGCKGISGGQKRRVSICIEILTRPTLLFLDEPTSGLDSAASYYVMKRIKSQLDHKDGRTVYFGPASAAIQFFASNGFPCPALQNPSDHMLKTINKDFDQENEVAPDGGTGTIPTEEVIRILVNSYNSSEMHQQVEAEVAMLSETETIFQDKKRSHAGFLSQCIVLTKRSFVNMFRDLGYYWIRLVAYIGMAICLGTVFYNVDTSYRSIKDRGSFLTFVSTFLTFMSIGGFPSFVEDMKVFERERLNGHYGVCAFVIGNTVSGLPLVLLVSLIPGTMAYYLAGLQNGYEQVLYFLCVLFTCVMLVESLMMIIAAMVPNYLLGIIIGSAIQGLMILLAGFFKLPNDIPKPLWKYPLHYMAFHRYAFQGLFKNEFQGLKFATNNKSNKFISGEKILRNVFEVDNHYSKWVDLSVLVGMLVLYRVLFFVTIKARENVKPFVASFELVSPKKTIHVMEHPNNTPPNNTHGHGHYLV
ncbi:ATP-binding cassette sub- G member 1 [Stylosanthes scabra]|uniref:ATP-binding cassette sub- G member 1 n=1 Tax=Stylosanthes scabra TaxID=79078 RepID=A0ABU6USU4_9FABA|nr:ATP-binding cassette sub- G member 1 [Stylosanthes scabra]